MRDGNEDGNGDGNGNGNGNRGWPNERGAREDRRRPIGRHPATVFGFVLWRLVSYFCTYGNRTFEIHEHAHANLGAVVSTVL